MNSERDNPSRVSKALDIKASKHRKLKKKFSYISIYVKLYFMFLLMFLYMLNCILNLLINISIISNGRFIFII